MVSPGVPRKVELRWINPPFGEAVTASFNPGWTMTTPQTGYAAPLGVRFRQHDGETVAMAESDVAVALLQGDGSLEQVLAPGVTLFGLAFVPRLLRRTRAPGA